MNKYNYWTSKEEDINLIARDLINKYDLKNKIPSNIIQSLESGAWKLTFQERLWIEKNPDKVKEYLQFRYKFYISRDSIIDEKFPLYMVVEPTSICNLRCKMCFQQDETLRKKPYRGFMDFKLFQKIIDEAENKGCNAITLAGRGEPLLNPDIIKFIDYTANKFMELKINTNGICLSEQICHSILRSNVSLLVFSAEGTNAEEYQESRCGGNFEKLLNNIKTFNKIRHEYYPESKTQTRVSGVLNTDISMDDYQNFWKEYVDEVVLVTLEERKDIYNMGMSSKKEEICYRLWNMIYIWWDGSISPCDIDYLNKLNLGNIQNENTIEDVWNGKRLETVRQMHKNCKRELCIPCDRCEV